MVSEYDRRGQEETELVNIKQPGFVRAIVKNSWFGIAVMMAMSCPAPTVGQR